MLLRCEGYSALCGPTGAIIVNLLHALIGYLKLSWVLHDMKGLIRFYLDLIC